MYLQKKIPQSSKMWNLNLLRISSYLHSIYIVLGIISNQQMIKSIRKEMHRLYENTTALYIRKRLEHLQIPVSTRVLEPIPRRGRRDNCTVGSEATVLNCSSGSPDIKIHMQHVADGSSLVGNLEISIKITILFLGIDFTDIDWYRHSKVFTVVFAITKD